MPEELEGQEALEETQEEATESTAEAEEEPKVVPVRVVKELRDELRQAKEDGALTRLEMNKLMSEYQKLIQGQANTFQQTQAKLDPEVQEAIAPYFKPVLAEIESLKGTLKNVSSENSQLKAERYIEKNAPFIPEIREELLKELQSLPKDEQDEIYANPRELVRFAKMVHRLKGGTSQSKEAMRSRAKTETGVTPNRSQTPRPAEMSDADRLKWMRANGWSV